ncbi:MAG: hypothetical protein U9Q15_03730, partial [Patescibacteria group bacterium]|nr:hypothetical protein [Patescibacteria group bacterium]
QEHMNGSIDIKNIKWPDSDTYTSIQLMDFIPQSNIDQDYDSGRYGAMFCIKFPLRIIDENEQLLEKI